VTGIPEVRGLTLWQPWASCIAYGTKRIENRTWSTGYRGLLLVHAGRFHDARAKDLPMTQPFLRRRQPYGAVVAVARLEDCHRDDGYCSLWSAHERWHWKLTDVTALKTPVSCSGARGLWIPPAWLLAAPGLARLLEVSA
jgi:ASCH domain